MDINLNGHVALITGATGGIGGAIAQELYDSGAAVVLTGRSQKKLNELTDKLVSENPSGDSNRIKCVALDFEKETDAEKKLVQSALQSFKKLDILVNNAGWICRGLILRTDKNFMEHMMYINYTVPYLLTRETLGYMRKQQYGRIINMTSISGQYGEIGMVAYSSTKSALTAFTKTVADEYGRYGITANCVAPGLIDTPMTRKLNVEYQKDVKQRIPARRFGEPKEVAALITFLASERAAYINGQEIAINGGLYR